MEKQNESKNGCFNRPPMKESYTARDGYSEQIASYSPLKLNAVPVSVEIKHNMSTDCKHQSDLDPRCAGCIHQKTDIPSSS